MSSLAAALRRASRPPCAQVLERLSKPDASEGFILVLRSLFWCGGRPCATADRALSVLSRTGSHAMWPRQLRWIRCAARACRGVPCPTRAARWSQHFEINHVVDLTLPKRILVTKLLGRRCACHSTAFAQFRLR